MAPAPTGLAVEAVTVLAPGGDAGKVILDCVELAVAQGEIVAVLGPSGCGKTTLLRAIAGLQPLDGGRITWDGEDLARVPTHARRFGLMFQDYALFPHRDVGGNVGFGLRMAHRSAADIDQRVGDVLAVVGLAGFEHRRIDTLSGGEQQRVALARSLAPEPRLLMLDEPLGALDRVVRERLLGELPGLLRRLGTTALYVTHDHSEAEALADRVAVMRAGRVEQVGRPEELRAEPASEFVAEFFAPR